jgi:hypothetical protein
MRNEISQTVASIGLKPTPSLRPRVPAKHDVKSMGTLPGLTLSLIGRQDCLEAQSGCATASPATFELKPRHAVPGSPFPRNGRHRRFEAHRSCATESPASIPLKPKIVVPGSPLSEKDAANVR